MPDLLAVKTGLLEALRCPGHCRTGCRASDLATALGCDPEAVTRAVVELNQQGYQINDDRGRWRLAFSPDTPFPFEFPGRLERMHYQPQASSTMDIARQMANAGCPHLTVIVTGIQTRGRGRLDRTWSSDEGGLYFTIVLRPREVRPAEAVKFNFMASLALVETLHEEYRIDARVKWPNDLMAGDRKLSGMLSEIDVVGDTINYLNIGIGVNVNNDPTAVEPRAVSVKSLTGRAYSRTRMLGLFLDRFEANLLARPDFAAVITGWKKHAGSLNREVTVVTLKEKLRGFAEDVDDRGSLVLRFADGTRRSICCGDCFYESHSS